MNRGAFSAVLDGNKILLVRSLTHRQFDDHWSLPGGLVEDDESFEIGAIREVFEETGITCEIVGRIHEVENKEDDITVEIFEAIYVSGDITLQAEEIADGKWIELEEALQLPLAFNTEDLLRELIAR